MTVQQLLAVAPYDPESAPPPDVVDVMERGLVEVVRRVEIYQADAETRWNPNTPGEEVIRLVEGNVTVDYNSDERRKLDLTLENIDQKLRPNPNGGLWYDKVIKVFRGVRYAAGDAKATVAIIEAQDGLSGANRLRQVLSSMGYDVTILLGETDVADLRDYQFIVSFLSTQATLMSSTLNALYEQGKNILTIGAGSGAEQLPHYGTFESFTQEWTGAINTSASVRRLNGVEVLRNRALRPIPTDGVYSWPSNDNSRFPVVADYNRVRRPGSVSLCGMPNNAAGVIMSLYAVGMASWSASGSIPVQPGEVLNLSIYATAEVPWWGSIAYSWWDASGANLSSSSINSAHFGANVWERIAGVTNAAPAGATHLRIAFYISSVAAQVPAGTRGWAQDFQATTGPTLHDYFDGNYGTVRYGVAPAQVPYPSVIKSANPVAYWELENSLADSVGSNALVGGPSFSYTRGRSETRGGRGLASLSVPIGAPSLTLEIWHKDDGTGGASYSSAFAGTTNDHHMIYFREQDCFGMYPDPGGPGSGAKGFLYGMERPTDGKWHHYVHVLTAATTSGPGTCKQYLDGVHQQTFAHGMDIVARPVARVGDWTGSYQLGLFDDPAIYNRALSDAEILDHYLSGVGRGGPLLDSPVAGAITPEVGAVAAVGTVATGTAAGAQRLAEWVGPNQPNIITAALVRNNNGGMWVDIHLPSVYESQARNLLRASLDYMRFIQPYKTWETQLGEFYIDGITTPNFPNQVKITARDGTKKLINDKLPKNATFPIGTSLRDFVRNMASLAGIPISKMRFNIGNETLSTEMSFERGTSRWDMIKSALESFGYERFFDGFGNFVVRKYIDPTTGPISMHFGTGPEGNLVTYEKSISDSRIYNHVIVTSPPSDEETNPVGYFGEAFVTDSTLPTHKDRIGNRVWSIDAPWLGSDAECVQLASDRLKITALESYNLNFSSIYYPWLEAGEIISIDDPDAFDFEPDRFLMDSIAYSLGLGPMSATGKRITYVGQSGSPEEIPVEEV